MVADVFGEILLEVKAGSRAGQQVHQLGKMVESQGEGSVKLLQEFGIQFAIADPGGKDKRKAGHGRPGFAQVVEVRESVFEANDPVADDQSAGGAGDPAVITLTGGNKCLGVLPVLRQEEPGELRPVRRD